MGDRRVANGSLSLSLKVAPFFSRIERKGGEEGRKEGMDESRALRRRIQFSVKKWGRRERERKRGRLGSARLGIQVGGEERFLFSSNFPSPGCRRAADLLADFPAGRVDGERV